MPNIRNYPAPLTERVNLTPRTITGLGLTLILTVAFWCPISRADPSPATQASKVAPSVLTEAQIEALIDKAGRTPPDWWNSVSLEYPSTLDLSGRNKVEGWHENINLGAYFWSVIKPNPSRWKQGTRLLHHVLTVRKDDPPRLYDVVNMLAAAYHDLLKDYPRAAFWRRKSIAMRNRPTIQAVVALAECYWKLGNKPMAEAFLHKYGLDRKANDHAIKLLARMGQVDRALELCEELARSGLPILANMTAGTVCRAAGRVQEALGYYQKVLPVSARGKYANWIRNQKQRAKRGIETIRLYEALDVSRIADGTYTGSSIGYKARIDVEVAVRNGKLEPVKIVRHKEPQALTSLTNIPEQILRKQGIRRIDAVTSATITSEAIVDAVAKALGSGMR